MGSTLRYNWSMIDRGVADGKSLLNETSWFRDTPHYWAEASLPLAYAVACVEVVCRNSEKAGAIYDEIVESWSDAGMRAISEEVASIIPESGKGRIKKAMLHPETELLRDPNRPFKNLEKLFTGMEVNEKFFKGKETAKLERLISEFIIVGFNRESEIRKGRYRVVPSEEAPWLIWTVAIRTALESYKITFERVRDFYKVRKRKGKIIDFQKVLTEQPMSRLHRQMVKSSKAIDLKLKNDKTIVEAARRWYQCRVVYPSIKMFCDAKSSEGIILELQNVDKQIEPCDDAVGYIRRLPRKTSK
jgi:hypothetical protein